MSITEFLLAFAACLYVAAMMAGIWKWGAVGIIRKLETGTRRVAERVLDGPRSATVDYVEIARLERELEIARADD